MSTFVNYIILAIYCIAPASCRSVRVTELSVPPAAVLGAPVRLACSYELGSEELYVVKWYKDDLEFYRYEPKDSNQAVYFPQPGIDIDLSKSDSNVVFLRTVAVDSSGSYKCQVSTDAPNYSCVQAVKEMIVIILPLGGPSITGGRPSYELGDNVTLNCTSGQSRPAARLRWTLNGRQIPDTWTVDHGIQEDSNNLQVSSKSVRLQVTEDLFQQGKAAFECEASFHGEAAMVSRKTNVLEINNAQECSCCRILLITSVLLLILRQRFLDGFPS